MFAAIAFSGSIAFRRHVVAVAAPSIQRVVVQSAVAVKSAVAGFVVTFVVNGVCRACIRRNCTPHIPGAV